MRNRREKYNMCGGMYLGIRDRGAMRQRSCLGTITIGIMIRADHLVNRQDICRLSRGITGWRCKGTAKDHVTRNREALARIRTTKVSARDRFHWAGRCKDR